MPDGSSTRVRPGLAPREHQATRLLALSFDSAASPKLTLGGFDKSAGGRAYGWGFAWYPEQSGAALVVKDATSVGDNAMTKLLREWDRFESTLFVAHLRGAARALQEQDTHPFSRAHGGRDWVLAHNGDLDVPEGAQGLAEALPLGERPVHEPVGRTDSERAFCWLLTRARDAGARSLSEIGWPRLHGWFRELDALGTANFLVSDGKDLVAYADDQGYNPLHIARFTPPGIPEALSTLDVTVDLEDVRTRHRTVVMVSTFALGEGFRTMIPGQMIAVRRGASIFDSHAGADERRLMVAPIGPAGQPTATTEVTSSPPEPEIPAVDLPRLHYHAQVEGEGRLLTVKHRTIYRYDHAVVRSGHVFRLQPVHDRWQDLLDHSLRISVDGAFRSHEDVFGNAVSRTELETPFTELVVEARSIVRVRGDVAEDLFSPHRRCNIPLVWMPWQRQMMTPYLLPPELPESQLRELSDYAMSFVERQDYDLVQTLADINITIYRDYSYASRSTTIATTPFDVLSQRRGVCQDFANLFICLARLLGIPARYRVGYIYTGGSYENKVQSDASHAWAELYLPWRGWQGFDPTNGCLVGRDHVRVAAGRNYGDATPTAGTIYKGGGGETLSVEVEVKAATAAP